MHEKRGIFSSRGKSAKSQAAVEYLMIAGIAFIITVPMMYILYQYTSEASAEVAQSKLEKIGTDIVNTAEQIFFLGEPSRTTLRFDMPEGVHDIYVTGDRTLVFVIGDAYNQTYVNIFSNVDIVSYLVPRDFTKGRKNLKIEAEKDHAVIYTGDKETALLEAYAFSVFKVFMDRAKDIMQAGFLIEGSGNNYVFDDIREDNDKAYLFADIPYVNVSADLQVSTIQDGLHFSVGQVNLDADGKISGFDEALSIEINSPSNFFSFWYAGQPPTPNAPSDLTFQTGKNYNLNITTSNYDDCRAALCNDPLGESADNYYLFIVTDKDTGSIQASAYVKVDDAQAAGTGLPFDKWFFGDVGAGVTTQAKINNIQPNLLVQKNEILSDQISEKINFTVSMHNISLSRGGMFFNISTEDELGNIGSHTTTFRPYYPMIQDSSFPGEYTAGHECEFNFERSGGSVKIGKGACS